MIGNRRPGDFMYNITGPGPSDFRSVKILCVGDNWMRNEFNIWAFFTSDQKQWGMRV